MNMAEEELRCPICAMEMKEIHDFIGIEVCVDCSGSLGLEDLEGSELDEKYSSIFGPKGHSILPKVSSLVKKTPKGVGWKVLSLAPFIGEQVEDPNRSGLMESALILMGSMIIDNGTIESGKDIQEEKMISLILIIGQYLDLSSMGKISVDNDLDQEGYLDEMILLFEHDMILYKLLKGLDHEDDMEKKTMIARAMKLLVR
jgi:hypothetical protein